MRLVDALGRWQWGLPMAIRCLESKPVASWLRIAFLVALSSISLSSSSLSTVCPLPVRVHLHRFHCCLHALSSHIFYEHRRTCMARNLITIKRTLLAEVCMQSYAFIHSREPGDTGSDSQQRAKPRRASPYPHSGLSF